MELTVRTAGLFPSPLPLPLPLPLLVEIPWSVMPRLCPRLPPSC